MVAKQVVTTSYLKELMPYIDTTFQLSLKEGFPAAPFVKDTPGLQANAYFFGQPKWAEAWLKFVHRSPLLKERRHAAAGSWNGKVVVDVGCGPGNLQANLDDRPAVLIGVDVSAGALQYAARLGYIPLLADAHKMPLRSGMADVVALNATIHHCDDMETVIAEAARLVKPGGYFITDHDPQKSAYDFRFLGKLLWNFRTIVYRILKRGGHRAEDDEQAWAAATEIHHKAGDGVTAEMFKTILEPMGFSVKLYPHNHTAGKEILKGKKGKASFKMRLAQILSGINSRTDAAALSLMCAAQKTLYETNAADVISSVL